MRILHLVAIPQLTGAAEPVLDLVYALRAIGAEVDLRIDTRRTGNLASILEARGDAVARDLVLSTKGGPLSGARDLARLRRLLPSYDVVHTHLSHDHALAALALGGRDQPLLVRTVHAARVLAPGFGRRWVLRRARGLTVACEAHRAILERVHGIEPGRVLVLPGSVDTRRFRPDPEARARIRAQLGLAGEHVAIGCVARFQAGRRHEVMLDGLARARREVPALRLLLIGHGETEAQLRARAAASDLEGGVVFCGYRREDLGEWLAALDASIWLVPGNDATSRAVLQAMASGLPVIGGAVDAIAETVIPGETGLLVDPEDADAVAAAMVKLARDAGARRAYGEQARRSAVERFDPIARARRVLARYQEWSGSRGPRALPGSA